jgi:hypothetical protein
VSCMASVSSVLGMSELGSIEISVDLAAAR